MCFEWIYEWITELILQALGEKGWARVKSGIRNEENRNIKKKKKKKKWIGLGAKMTIVAEVRRGIPALCVESWPSWWHVEGQEESFRDLTLTLHSRQLSEAWCPVPSLTWAGLVGLPIFAAPGTPAISGSRKWKLKVKEYKNVNLVRFFSWCKALETDINMTRTSCGSVG
jgi:hypothetical protein